MLEPQVIRREVPQSKRCSCCGKILPGENYVKSANWIYSDGLAPLCNFCIQDKMKKCDWDWDKVDKLCQALDIPFIPEKFEELHKTNGNQVFPIYAQIFQESIYEGLSWKDYYEEFKELKRLKLFENELPEIRERRVNDLKERWGRDYDEEQLDYLEGLFNGMLATQNINGALQTDQAMKVCKLNLSIDECIRAGETKEIKSLVDAQEKIIKSADFTPKNVKNANDFSSFSEVAYWLEKQGWVNNYYDGATKDQVDETLNNLQAFNQRLYLNESGIGENITSRIEALKAAEVMESKNYDLGGNVDLDDYSQESYEGLNREETELILEDEDEDILGRGI